jgi:hypothetical protein
LGALSEGEMIAMGWACEMTALTGAAEIAGDRVLWLKFDDFLAEPAAHLASTLRHIGLEVSSEEVATIISSDEMRRYSKAPEHTYDAKLRRDVLDEARRTDATEIRRGLEWLDHAATLFSAVGKAVIV